jgi:hypothetical protein
MKGFGLASEGMRGSDKPSVKKLFGIFAQHFVVRGPGLKVIAGEGVVVSGVETVEEEWTRDG